MTNSTKSHSLVFNPNMNHKTVKVVQAAMKEVLSVFEREVQKHAPGLYEAMPSLLHEKFFNVRWDQTELFTQNQYESLRAMREHVLLAHVQSSLLLSRSLQHKFFPVAAELAIREVLTPHINPDLASEFPETFLYMQKFSLLCDTLFKWQYSTNHWFEEASKAHLVRAVDLAYSEYVSKFEETSNSTAFPVYRRVGVLVPLLKTAVAKVLSSLSLQDLSLFSYKEVLKAFEEQLALYPSLRSELGFSPRDIHSAVVPAFEYVSSFISTAQKPSFLYRTEAKSIEQRAFLVYNPSQKTFIPDEFKYTSSLVPTTSDKVFSVWVVPHGFLCAKPNRNRAFGFSEDLDPVSLRFILPSFSLERNHEVVETFTALVKDQVRRAERDTSLKTLYELALNM